MELTIKEKLEYIMERLPPIRILVCPNCSKETLENVVRDGQKNIATCDHCKCEFEVLRP